jgi:hypothetical protein
LLCDAEHGDRRSPTAEGDDMETRDHPTRAILRNEHGSSGMYIVLWLLGVPLPILLALYVLRGCS